MQLSLQPDRSLEAAANCRLTEKIFAVDADIKLYIIALYSHLFSTYTDLHFPFQTHAKDCQYTGKHIGYGCGVYFHYIYIPYLPGII